MISHLCRVKRINVILLLPHPRSSTESEASSEEITTLYRLKQIALMRLAVFGYYGLGFLIGKILYTLKRDKMKLHPCALIVLIDEAVGCDFQSVHIAERCRRNAPRRHWNGDLVRMLQRKQCPEIPVCSGIAHAGAGDLVLWHEVEIGEISTGHAEKHRSVITHKIPIALVGVKLHLLKTAYVALSASAAPRSPAAVGESHQTIRSFYRTSENIEAPGKIRWCHWLP